MSQGGNIVISDASALHALLHADLLRYSQDTAAVDPLAFCADTLRTLEAFNTDHPLYGAHPITLLVRDREAKRSSKCISCRTNGCPAPRNSFFKLRDGLYMTSPEFTYLRMAAFASPVQLAEIGTNLCARYYIDVRTHEIRTRSGFIATPQSLSHIVAAADPRQRKRSAAESALRWVAANSGSPAETKMKLQLCCPLSHGGFNLPFTAMNYDVSAGALASLTSQGRYSIDLASPSRRFGVEYDGRDYHQDASHDKQRRNELAALGWTIFPIDGRILYNADETARAAELIAKAMKVRLRRSPAWESKFIALRQRLELPV